MPVQNKKETKKEIKKSTEAQAEELADALGKFFAFRAMDRNENWDKYLKQITFIEDNLRSTNLQTLLQVEQQAQNLENFFQGQFSREKTATMAKAKMAYWGEPLDQAEQLLILVRKIREKQLDLQPEYDESKEEITPTP